MVAGVSGGATLGLALAAAGVPAAAVLHEPAVGSLLPGLLDQVRAAYAEGGVPAFARALYGPAWTAAEAPADPGAVARDLAMFTRFEPAAPAPEAGPVIITVGERSPAVRHEAAARLADAVRLPGRGHPRRRARGASHPSGRLRRGRPPDRRPARLTAAGAQGARSSCSSQAAARATRSSDPAGASRVTPCGRPAAVKPGRDGRRAQVEQVAERRVVPQHRVARDRVGQHLRRP